VRVYILGLAKLTDISVVVFIWSRCPLFSGLYFLNLNCRCIFLFLWTGINRLFFFFWNSSLASLFVFLVQRIVLRPQSWQRVIKC
jgi:hypothetical protein